MERKGAAFNGSFIAAHGHPIYYEGLDYDALLELERKLKTIDREQKAGMFGGAIAFLLVLFVPLAFWIWLIFSLL